MKEGELHYVEVEKKYDESKVRQIIVRKEEHRKGPQEDRKTQQEDMKRIQEDRKEDRALKEVEDMKQEDQQRQEEEEKLKTEKDLIHMKRKEQKLGKEEGHLFLRSHFLNSFRTLRYRSYYDDEMLFKSYDKELYNIRININSIHG